MGTQFNDSTDTAYDGDGVRAFQSPPIVTAVEGISTAVLARLKKSGGTMTGALTLHADPSSALHAATKQYVDSVSGGGLADWKDSVRAASTANVTLSTGVENGDTLDGVTLATGDRILLKNQTTGSENGIYTVNASGAPTRATDADGAGEFVQGTSVLVREGSTLSGTTWFITTSGTITIGTTATTWVQTTAAASLADNSVSTAKLQGDAVTFAKMQNVTSDRLLGRDTASSGDVEEISLTNGLEFTGSTGIQTTLGVRLRVNDVGVCQFSGTTYAFDSTGVILSAATSAANNVTVIQAAIDAIAGTYTNGHGGGGEVVFDGSNYSISAYLDVKPGVSLRGNGSFDRNGLASGGSPAAHALYGTTFTPTSGLSSTVDIRPDGTTVNKRPVILLGRVRYTSTTATNSATSTSLPVASRTYFPQSGDFSIDVGGNSTTVTAGHGTGAGTFTINSTETWTSGDLVELTEQSTTNPHGVRITGINVDCRNAASAQAILIVDSQFVTVDSCNLINAYSSGGKGVEVYSSIAPDDGAHGTRIVDSMIANCYEGVYGSGSGSTDSFVTGCRIVQCINKSVYLGASGGGGGWQISDNHFTTGSGTSCDHVEADAPATIVNNYFDACGGWHLILNGPATVVGNVFSAKDGNVDNKVAPITVGSGGGRLSTIVGNVAQCKDSSYDALVHFGSTSGDMYRPVITGNLLLAPSGSTPIGIACTGSFGSTTAIAETGAGAADFANVARGDDHVDVVDGHQPVHLG